MKSLKAYQNFKQEDRKNLITVLEVFEFWGLPVILSPLDADYNEVRLVFDSSETKVSLEEPSLGYALEELKSRGAELFRSGLVFSGKYGKSKLKGASLNFDMNGTKMNLAYRTP